MGRNLIQFSLQLLEASLDLRGAATGQSCFEKHAQEKIEMARKRLIDQSLPRHFNFLLCKHLLETHHPRLHLAGYGSVPPGRTGRDAQAGAHLGDELALHVVEAADGKLFNELIGLDALLDIDVKRVIDAVDIHDILLYTDGI